jgi:hypothetical protein
MVGEVRSFTAKEVPAVASLFRKIFQKEEGPAPEALVQYFHTAFFQHPMADPELPSFVHVRPNGSVSGFIGVYPVPLVFRERRIRAAFCGNLMVDPATQDPLAGARLLLSFLEGAQDVSLTETANQVSVKMWRKWGRGRVVANRSLNWARIFYPSSWATSVASKHARYLMLARPVAMAIDRLIARALPPLPDPSSCRGDDVDPTELSEVVRKTSKSYSLHPDFDDEALSFLLKEAATKERFGDPIARIVRNRRGEAIGGYLAHRKKHRTLKVFQIFASPGSADLVVNDLFARAVAMEMVGVVGRTQPEILPALAGDSATFFFGGEATTLAAARNRELLAAACGDDNFLNGLAGESWVRFIGNEFEDIERP